MCPKQTSKANAVRSRAIYAALTAMANMQPGNPAIAEAMEGIKRIIATTPADTKGVRLDLEITTPDGQDLWVDFAGVHPTTRTAQTKLARWLALLAMSDYVGGGAAANSPAARTPSPAVELTVGTKEKRYELLMQLAQQQAHAGRRTHTPFLCAAVITHLGELSPDFITLIEKLTTAAATSYRGGPLTDGAQRKTFTRRFRTRLKDGIMAANASGFGRALRSAGNPMPGWVCSQLDELHMPTWDDPTY